MKWAFSAKPGDISQIYDCGDNDRMLVVAVTAEYEPGYVPMNNVRDMLMSEVLKDKKSEKIIADLKAKNITSFDGYKSLDNVISDTLKHITFSAPASVMRIGAQEPCHFLKHSLHQLRILIAEDHNLRHIQQPPRQ